MQDLASPVTHITLEEFPLLDLATLKELLSKLKSGSPVDPAPPPILFKIQKVVAPVILEVINASLQSGEVPPLWKQARVKALLKKTYP